MTAMTPTELRDRLDRLADAHVADLETPLPVASSGAAPPNRNRLVLVAAAVAVLAGSWFLVRTTGEDGKESPAVRVETLGEPQLNLPAWTELPIVDLDDLEPDIAEMFREGRLDVDLTTLRLVDADGVQRFVGLSPDHLGTFYGAPMPGGSGRGFSSGGSPGSLALINDNYVVQLGFMDGQMQVAEAIGLVPSRYTAVAVGDAEFGVNDGLLYLRGETETAMRATQIDGTPIEYITTVGEPGSFIRGRVVMEGQVAVFDIGSAVCLQTPDGLRATAGLGVGSEWRNLGVSPEGVTATLVDDDTFLFASATAEADEFTTTELGGGRLRVEIDGDELSGTIEVQCINPPTLEMLVAAMRGEG